MVDFRFKVTISLSEELYEDWMLQLNQEETGMTFEKVFEELIAEGLGAAEDGATYSIESLNKEEQ